VIVILSNLADVSTDLVEEHFIYNKINYARLNAEDIFDPSFKLDFDNEVIKTARNIIKIDSVNVVWYRKFGFLSKNSFYQELKEEFEAELVNHLVYEHYELLEAIIDLFSNKKWLTNPKHTRLNKLTILKQAEKTGLKIPGTYLINSRKNLKQLISNKKLITKSVFETLFFNKDKHNFSMFTKEITMKNLSEVPNVFFPSLVQEKIEKDFEVRVFILRENCFSMAIFSQSNGGTATDFRDINWENPIRFTPFNLPKSIEIKLLKLVSSIGLNCCSIDLIKTKDEYYFLEINSVGEFGMVSFPCNYDIHYYIYKTLKEMDEDEK